MSFFVQYPSLLTAPNPDYSHSPAKVSEDLETTLSDFGLEHLDLYLMHWPVAKSNGKSYIEYLDVGNPRLPFFAKNFFSFGLSQLT